MDGKTNSVKEDISKLSPELIEYFGTKNDEGKEIKEYRWNKFIEVLQDEWYLHYYAKKMRGFMVSFDLTKEALIDKAIDKRPSTKKQIRKLREKELERKALEKRGLIEPTKPEPTKDSQKDEIKVIDIQQTDNTQITYIKEPQEIEEVVKCIYSEKDFLYNWGVLRSKYMKQPTSIKKLDFNEAKEFEKAKKEFTKEEINKALYGLFKQQNENIASMYLRR